MSSQKTLHSNPVHLVWIQVAYKTHTGEKATWRTRQRLEQCIYKIRKAKNCQKTTRSKERAIEWILPPSVFNALTLDFWPPERKEDKFLLF